MAEVNESVGKNLVTSDIKTWKLQIHEAASVSEERGKKKRTKYAVVEDFAYRHCYGQSFFVFGYNCYEKKPQV